MKGLKKMIARWEAPDADPEIKKSWECFREFVREGLRKDAEQKYKPRGSARRAKPRGGSRGRRGGQ